ncbi:hypothetical protein MY4038_005174 [Beauveria bassiana]
MEARQTIDAESIRFAAFVLDVPAEYLQQLLIDPSKGDKSGQPLPAPAEASQSATSQSHFADDELQRITFSDGIEEAYIASVGAKNDVSNWQVCSTLPTLQQTSLESQSNDFVAHHDQLNAQYITPFASQKQTHEKQLAPSARPNPASLQRPSHDGSSSHRSNFVPIAMPPSTGSRSSREEFLPKKNSPSRIRDLVELVGTQEPCSSTWTLPRYLFSRRWQSMDLVDITTWSSFETKEIAISQIFLDAPLKLTVREFTPMDGDMLEETWKSGDSTIVHSLPRYAIVEMNEAACTIGSFIDKSIGAYITAMVDGPDNLLWCTYMMAFKQVSTAQLTLFVLLHGCALVTRRDAETATQYGLTQPYANPKSIQAHQSGAQTMLAHWHYVDKGLKPFQMALTSEGLKEVAKRANLNPEQTDLVRTTATWIRDQGSSIQAMKTTRAFGHNLYWIVQMFEEGCEPGPTA